MDYEKLKSNIPEGWCGDWSVVKYEVTKNDEISQAFSALRNGGRYVPVGTYTALKRGRTVVMSDTPDEIRDLREPLKRAEGVCLVNGLGLGILVGGMLEKEGVEKVIAIENSSEVISLVGPYYKGRYGERFEIRLADAFEYKPPRGEVYNVVWHDVWDYICGDNWKDMTKLHRKYGKRCGWQGSWMRDAVKRLDKQNKYHARITFNW